MIKSGSLDDKQIAAIRRSEKIARALVKDHPEIAEMYINGIKLTEIAERLNLQSQYGNWSKGTYKTAIWKALAGNTYGTNTFEGLVDRKTLDTVANKYRVERGTEMYKSAQGVHGMTAEQRKSAGQKGGEIGGRAGGNLVVKRKLGIHGMTLEERTEASEKGNARLRELGKGACFLSPEKRSQIGRQLYEQGKGFFDKSYKHVGVIARGDTPWIPRLDFYNFIDGSSAVHTHSRYSEEEFVYRLSLDPAHQYQEGQFKGKPILKKIAETTNREYHAGKPIRNKNTVACRLSAYRKKIEN